MVQGTEITGYRSFSNQTSCSSYSLSNTWMYKMVDCEASSGICLNSTNTHGQINFPSVTDLNNHSFIHFRK
jgi:hypothetical protein